MIIHNMEQGSTAWWQVRIGVATASEFDKILTPAKLEPSRSVDGYINKLLGEWLRNKPDEGFESEWMKRGKEVEQEARDYYAFHTGAEVQQVGFCYIEDGNYGCSPDGLVEDGGLEIKCPSPGIHVGYILDGRVPLDYRLQILGSLLVTGREYWDFISYHPDIEPLIIRTWQKDVMDELNILNKALWDVDRKLKAKQKILIERGFKK